MSIVIQDLVKMYGDQPAVDAVSFDINSGEIVGFIGPNGAGKSTVMKIICGYISATSGSVTVNGFDVQKQSKEVRRSIGYLPEHNPLYLDMYVREYLTFVAGLYQLGSKIKGRVTEMIEATGLVSEQHKKIGFLSKGYRQRVGLAQALIHDPEVLILDEPTTGLDPNQIIEIRTLISEVGKSKTVLLSTHIMQEVEAICQRTIIINKGKLVANAAVKDVQKENSYDGQTVTVEFSTPVTETDLLEVHGVKKAIKLEGNKWLIYGQKDIDIRTSLFQLAVERKMAVLEMQQHEKTLEDVFHELTAGKKN
ncbi:MAG: gliding motility-associated ABC transporter ATP-binding subunit GldA [Bacteroidales bacterium]|nr:gliding motility-associated ABC transporter ATP-binding subunit GldA [Bacteroidales bacterium]